MVVTITEIKIILSYLISSVCSLTAGELALHFLSRIRGTSKRMHVIAVSQGKPTFIHINGSFLGKNIIYIYLLDLYME